MAASRKAKVTHETISEAALLKTIWESKSPVPNQAVFGETFEVGGQSAVGQFLRGETPLGLKAAAGFARGLECTIFDFSPRLAEQARLYGELSGLAGSAGGVASENELERQLLLFFRQLPEDKKDMLIAMANGWANMANPEKTKARVADPFPNAPPPGSNAVAPRPSKQPKAKGRVDADH